MKNRSVEPRETVCRAVFKSRCRNEKISVENRLTVDQHFFLLNSKMSNRGKVLRVKLSARKEKRPL